MRDHKGRFLVNCGMNKKWQSFYQHKSKESIEGHLVNSNLICPKVLRKNSNTVLQRLVMY